MTPIKTALASFGMSGKVFHGPFLKTFPEYDVVKVLERTKNESTTLFPKAEIVRSYEELLNDDTIELIIINTPNYLHYEMTKKALIAGKHVVVEKPFTTTVEEAQTLIELANENGVTLSVYHNRRWDSDFLTIQNLIETNQLGDIEYYEAHFDRYRPEIGVKKWKEEQFDGAGILYDLGSHLIDQALVLFGTPKNLKSDIQVQRENGVVPDYFHFTLAYENLKVVLTAGMLVKASGPRYVVKGTKGEFIKHGQDTQEQALIEGIMPDNPQLGIEPESNWGSLNDAVIPSLKGNYGAFYTQLYLAIRENKKAPVMATEALKVIELIEKGIKQSQEHPAN